MKALELVLISTLVLTVTTKIGFILQRVYVDIRGIALASILSVITGGVMLGYPILAVLFGCTMFLYLLCKIGEIQLMPDAIFSSVLGIGAIGILVVNNFI